MTRLDLTTSRLLTCALYHCAITVCINFMPHYKKHPIADYCPYILRTPPKTFRKLICRVHGPYNQYVFDRSITLDNNRNMFAFLSVTFARYLSECVHICCVWHCICSVFFFLHQGILLCFFLRLGIFVVFLSAFWVQLLCFF